MGIYWDTLEAGAVNLQEEFLARLDVKKGKDVIVRERGGGYYVDWKFDFEFELNPNGEGDNLNWNLNFQF